MNLDRFNLNLFVAFEALCNAETLTQAAGEICVTQSTLSVALRQMREYFDDELFVYKAKQKELTPLAQNLRPRILEIIKSAKATLMLKEDIASGSYDLPTVKDLAVRRAFVIAAEPHIQRRALKPRLLELDRRC
jgi:LysR family transcriptional regulator, nod-box dependent transcriptional activator